MCIRDSDYSGKETVADNTLQNAIMIRDGKIISTDGSQVSVYDIYGRRVSNDNLATGLYIVVAGSCREKLLIRN